MRRALDLDIGAALAPAVRPNGPRPPPPNSPPKMSAQVREVTEVPEINVVRGRLGQGRAELSRRAFRFPTSESTWWAYCTSLNRRSNSAWPAF